MSARTIERRALREDEPRASLNGETMPVVRNVSLGPVERLDEVASADLWAKLLLAANRKGSKLLAKFRAMLHVFDSWARLFYSAAAPSLFVMPDSGEWQPVDALTLSTFVHAVGQGAIVKGGYFVGDYKPPVSYSNRAHCADCTSEVSLKPRPAVATVRRKQPWLLNFLP